jgi:hypothetical protein
MKETDLRSFFEGSLSANDLALALDKARLDEPINGAPLLVEQIEPTEEPFEVTAVHLNLILKAALAREIKEMDLVNLAFILLYSEHYTWNGETEDGERVSTTVFDWDASDENFALSRNNLKKWQTYLHTGEYKFTNEEA